VRVTRNNGLSLEDLEALAPRGLVISPGPGRPEAAGITVAAIQRFSGRIPILGVCLGHQAIAIAFGGQVTAARRLMHGKTSAVTADGRELFQGIPSPFEAMRYHSLAVARASLPACLEVTAEAEDGEVMGLRHRSHPTEGVQFHPESIMTTVGKRLLRNFLKMTHQTLFI
jgi:anthranilate synthase/aminodeoxychorismate synthase-like glutamine amidotransferase